MRLAASPARNLAFVAFILLASPNTHLRSAAAKDPELAFDFGRTLECRDVTPADFAEAYPDERIVECTLRLSVYLSAGNIADVETVRVEISDHDRRLRVFEFSPSTRLESTLAADVEWTKTTEATHELGASLGGELPACIGDVVANVTPSVNAVKGGREVVTEKQIRLAPKQAVVASGTIESEHGVFFTLRRSPQNTLEGVHEFTVAFVVPAGWRGDAVRISCQATGEQKILWMKQHKVWAEKASGIALYMAGDVEARRAAERTARR